MQRFQFVNIKIFALSLTELRQQTFRLLLLAQPLIMPSHSGALLNSKSANDLMTYPSNGIFVVASLMMMYSTTSASGKAIKRACWLRA